MGCSKGGRHCWTAFAVLVPSPLCELPGSAADMAGGAEAHGSRLHAPAAEYSQDRLLHG